ncbi:hypothetical protein [Dyadobacter sp. BHUBP1]|uniref:hypothetical protein n=1 Tax=Dyadobacter sp. BHUBP1 TaxID=3424178 RepID=UPI003D3333B2
MLSINALCQTDSVFLHENPEPVLGKVLINHKSGKASVKGAGHTTATFLFNEIRRIGLGNGGTYISENLKSQVQLLLLLVEGKFSLLFNEKERLYYVRTNDSLLVISQAHFKRALPLIFGKELTDGYYIKSNTAPNYTAKYLKKLTSYANMLSHSSEVIHEQTINQFKVRVSLGLLAGFGYNRTAFDVRAGDIGGRVVYKKSPYMSGTSMPLGLSLDIALAKRMSIRFDGYRNNLSIQNLNINDFGDARIAFPNYLLHPELYDPSLQLTELSYKTWQIDIAGSYTIIRPDRSKLTPYLFAGPSIVRLKSAEMGLSTRYRETEDAPYNRITGYVLLDRPVHMIGFNAGLGAQYHTGKRWTFRLAVKFVGGIYTKISHTRMSPKVKNETTKPDNTWNFGGNVFSNVYDQYTRNLSVNGGAYFRL